MYEMYYVSMLRYWQLVRILVRTNHPCLRVGRHRGFTQRPGVDYDETFNPIVKPATMRTVLATAVSHN
jgi:hypothetical protein